MLVSHQVSKLKLVGALGKLAFLIDQGMPSESGDTSEELQSILIDRSII